MPFPYLGVSTETQLQLKKASLKLLELLMFENCYRAGICRTPQPITGGHLSSKDVIEEGLWLVEYLKLCSSV